MANLDIKSTLETREAAVLMAMNEEDYNAAVVGVKEVKKFTALLPGNDQSFEIFNKKIFKKAMQLRRKLMIAMENKDYNGASASLKNSKIFDELDAEFSKSCLEDAKKFLRSILRSKFLNCGNLCSQEIVIISILRPVIKIRI